MNEQLNGGATSASMDSELLKVLIDKTVDNGTAIRETQDQIRRLSPDAAVAGFEERVGALEGVVVETGKALNERMAGVEKAMDEIGGEVLRIGSEVGGPGTRLVAKMGELRDSLENYVEFFKGPTKKEVHHRHILGPAVWVVVFMGVMIVGLLFGCVTLWNRLDRYERSAWLWRGALLSEDRVVVNALDTTVRSYNANPEQFMKDVQTEEERRTELSQHRWQEEQERQEVQKLERQKKKR